MTVKELKKLLKDCNDDDIVVMSKDGEGNNFSPLSDISEQYYVADSTWSGETYDRSLEDYSNEEKEGIKEESVNCITLWPTN